MTQNLGEYKSTYGFCNFLQKPQVWEKSSSWVMFKKHIEQSECRILQTAISQKRVEVWSFIFYVVWHPWKQQIYSVILSGYGKVCLDMSRIMSDSKSASSQECFEQQRCFLHVLRDPQKLQICWIISGRCG